MTDPAPGLATPYRTHTAGQLRASDAGTAARLAGWVHRRRDHGQLIFLDIRDRYGITQVVIDKTESPGAHEIASRVRIEFVVSVGGVVAPRLAGTENPRLPTGAIELRANDVDILSDAKTPPFYINEPDAPIDESLRLKYATSTSAGNRWPTGCSFAAGWSRRSARSITGMGSSRSRRPR
jgi:aspartyl-tRNA synthetase